MDTAKRRAELAVTMDALARRQSPEAQLAFSERLLTAVEALVADELLAWCEEAVVDQLIDQGARAAEAGLS